MTPDERLLRQGLEHWRLLRLQEIETQMRELAEEHKAASEGLAIAHRNPGEVEQEVIEILWDRLNETATELARLEEVHQKIMEMDLPHLVVTFERSKKKKTWPWELETWDLSIF